MQDAVSSWYHCSSRGGAWAPGRCAYCSVVRPARLALPLTRKCARADARAEAVGQVIRSDACVQAATAAGTSVRHSAG